MPVDIGDWHLSPGYPNDHPPSDSLTRQKEQIRDILSTELILYKNFCG